MYLPRRKNLIKKTLEYFLMLCLLTLLAGTTLVGVQWFSDSVQNFFAGKVASENMVTAAVSLPEPVKPISKPEINAQAIYAIQDQAVLFEQDARKPLPVASLTKLMTALVVLERYDVNQVRDLLFSMLIESSNQAAETLSGMMGQDLFVMAMNARAKELGMVNTHFADSSGLSPKSISSAADIAILSQYIYEQYPLFRQIISLPVYGTMINTNKLIGKDGIIGGKTGYTGEAKGCFMAIRALPNGSYSINVVLGADDRFLEMEKLIHLTSNF